MHADWAEFFTRIDVRERINSVIFSSNYHTHEMKKLRNSLRRVRGEFNIKNGSVLRGRVFKKIWYGFYFVFTSKLTDGEILNWDGKNDVVLLCEINDFDRSHVPTCRKKRFKFKNVTLVYQNADFSLFFYRPKNLNADD